MKRLTLLRHAKSAWDDPISRDIDRPLNRRGRLAARAIGDAMRAEHLHFDRVIASPAARVTETIDDVEEAYGTSLEAVFDERLYLASLEMLLELVRATSDSIDALLVVGHNPGLERFALFVTREGEGPLRAELEEKYPTATLAGIDLSIDRWSELGKGSGRLVRFIRPRDLDPGLGPDES